MKKKKLNSKHFIHVNVRKGLNVIHAGGHVLFPVVTRRCCKFIEFFIKKKNRKKNLNFSFLNLDFFKNFFRK